MRHWAEPDGAKNPAGQRWQVNEDPDPDCAKPGRQLHDEEPTCDQLGAPVPRGHLWHAREPAVDEKKPTGQAVQVKEVPSGELV